jgi:hypothetical protein
MRWTVFSLFPALILTSAGCATRFDTPHAESAGSLGPPTFYTINHGRVEDKHFTESDYRLGLLNAQTHLVPTTGLERAVGQ